MKTKFTTSQFERSHGRKPKGFGGWAFSRSTSASAFESDLFGEVEFFSGTLTEAKKLAAAKMTGAEFLAVLS